MKSSSCPLSDLPDASAGPSSFVTHGNPDSDSVWVDATFFGTKLFYAGVASFVGDLVLVLLIILLVSFC